jgi:hypothetical protein
LGLSNHIQLSVPESNSFSRLYFFVCILSQAYKLAHVLPVILNGALLKL